MDHVAAAIGSQNAKFAAIHMQEVGGKKAATSKPVVKKLVRLLQVKKEQKRGEKKGKKRSRHSQGSRDRTASKRTRGRVGRGRYIHRENRENRARVRETARVTALARLSLLSLNSALQRCTVIRIRMVPVGAAPA